MQLGRVVVCVRVLVDVVCVMIVVLIARVDVVHPVNTVLVAIFVVILSNWRCTLYTGHHDRGSSTRFATPGSTSQRPASKHFWRPCRNLSSTAAYQPPSRSAPPSTRTGVAYSPAGVRDPGSHK